jgi:hypothetical protein
MKLASAVLPAVLAILARSAESNAEESVTPAAVGEGASGLRVGFSSGYALPVGSTFKGSGDLSDTIAGQVPLRFDIGYRVERHVTIGGSVDLGLIVPRACSSASGASCSGTDVRLGAMIAFELWPTRLFDPWLAVGAGFESLHVTRALDGEQLDLSARGFVLLDAEFGADFRLSPRMRIGPVLEATLSRYTRLDVNGAPTTDFDPVLHEWVSLGVRCTFDL